jgi:4'-phosphopantetheinyl transferase
MNQPAPGRADVWSAVLSAPPSAVDHCSGLLSPDEAARAARFHFDEDRRRFVLARGLLRLLLGGYLEADPRSLEFSYSAAGKPDLGRPSVSPPLRFNVAHSGGRVLYALARGAAIGVDIEKVRDEVDVDGISRRFFAPGEGPALARLRARSRRRRFFETWARKEAVLKASGLGISAGLDAIEVGPDAGGRLVLVRCQVPRIDPRAWSIEDVPVASGFVAAIAVNEAGVSVVRRRWRW